MKTIVSTFILLTSFCLVANAQLVADAGPDKVNCSNADNHVAPVLGGDTVAWGGVPPYTYKWEAHEFSQIGTWVFHYWASSYLDDTTAAHPTVLYPTCDINLTYKLTVTDASNATAVDSVVVSTSSFAWTLDYWEFTIDQGESIYLDWGAQAYSNCPPFQHYWHPTHGISDSTSCCFWAQPDHTISYFCKVTDALGCYVDGFRYKIYVRPVATNELDIVSASIFPNPADKVLNFKLKDSPSTQMNLIIASITGKVILQQSIDNVEFTTDISHLPAGEYIYRITGQNERIYAGIFLKQ